MNSGTEGTEGSEASGAERDRGAAVYPGEATSGMSDGYPAADAAEPGGEAAAEQQEERAEPLGGDTEEPLLGTTETEEYRRKWSEIQGRFVDDPQDAVRSADTLVAEVMQALAGSFSSRKQGLEGQWGRGEQVATEDLRVSLQHYRSFFNRLLKT
ncbi:hypothetical protein [Streptomyces sp. A0592]|uniref:hypothetical protein n=1 Tax=Streptomyces sp. A0592 TaxID=2563099 RepID=UPI00109E4F5C|nr:hypothetical protein [Streptomyces sp. A0592]THA86142.1 hypothetical protein E6U81_03830 [Streptomyces sp. A0592]